MVKVLITIGRLERGGAEMRLLDLLDELTKRGAQFLPILYVVSGKAGVLDERFRAAGAQLLFGCSGIGGLWDFFRTLRRERPDIVHANASLAAGVYLAIATLAGVERRFAHIRSTGHNEVGIARMAKDFGYRFLLNRFATRVVGVCDATLQLARTSPTKWQTIYNGIRLPGPLSVTRPEHLDLLMLGRLSYEKNPARVLPVVEILRVRLGNRLRFRYVGVGPLALDLETEVKLRGLSAVVEIAGATDKPLETAASASVVVLTSRREGLPGVLLEALAVGTPVVAIDLPGVREIARFVEGVSIMALDASDDEWADAILAAAVADRSAIAASFARSPFQLGAHVASMATLWFESFDDQRSTRSETEYSPSGI